jgi:hypothetical protein
VLLNRIGYWNINNSVFNSLASGVDASVNALSLDASNNKLYIGGAYLTASGGTVTMNRVGYWNINKNNFYGLSGGLDGAVRSMDYDTSNNVLYLGGEFNNTISGTVLNKLGLFNLNTNAYAGFTSNGFTGLNGNVNYVRYNSDKNGLYMAGEFTQSTSGVLLNLGKRPSCALRK